MKKSAVISLFLVLIISFLSSLKAETVEKEAVYKRLAQKLSSVESRLKNKTVAVYGFDMIGRKDDSYSRYATEKLTHELVETGRLVIIERSRIDKILNEQQLKMAGIIDADAAAKIGKILSVDGVVIGSIAVSDSEVELIARVIQSETAVILKSADFSYKTGDSNVQTSYSVSADKQNKQPVVSVHNASEKNPGSNAEISVKARVFEANRNITVNYSGLPGNNYDWITLVKAEKPDNQYGQWTYTYGKKNGTFTFTGVRSGSYEIRIYYDWPAGGYVVQRRVKITVK